MTKLWLEDETIRKVSDYILTKAANIIIKGDHLHKIERLIQTSERTMTLPFHVDYISGVMLEQNSILNFAIIQQQHRTTKWLIETMHADINTVWSGGRYLVRLMLGHGVDQKKVGKAHYSKVLNHADYECLTAEGWAQKKGFNELAVLIRLGLS